MLHILIRRMCRIFAKQKTMAKPTLNSGEKKDREVFLAVTRVLFSLAVS